MPIQDYFHVGTIHFFHVKSGFYYYRTKNSTTTTKFGTNRSIAGSPANRDMERGGGTNLKGSDQTRNSSSESVTISTCNVTRTTAVL